MKKETIAGVINLLMMAFGIVTIFLCGYLLDYIGVIPTFLFFVMGVMLIGARVEVTKGEVEESAVTVKYCDSLTDDIIESVKKGRVVWVGCVNCHNKRIELKNRKNTYGSA